MDNSSNKINVREHRRAIQRNYQHWEHKAHAETNKQKTHTHHYAQTSTNNVNKTLTLLQTKQQLIA